MNNEFWNGFIQGIFYWVIGLWIAKQLLVMMITNAVKKHIEENPEEYGGEILLYVEKHHDMLYCYRKDTDEFVGQGKTMQEIADIFIKRFPKNKGTVLKDDGAHFINQNADAK